MYSRTVGYSYDASRSSATRTATSPSCRTSSTCRPTSPPASSGSRTATRLTGATPGSLEHTLGKYVIADRPMTEQEWIEARADVIDVTPEPERDK